VQFVNCPLECTIFFLGKQADAERRRADRELTEAERDLRREQAALFQRQAESIRHRVKAGEKAQAEAVKRRDKIEDRICQW
jgi:RNA-splicing ligase RtcB